MDSTFVKKEEQEELFQRVTHASVAGAIQKTVDQHGSAIKEHIVSYTREVFYQINLDACREIQKRKSVK